ncbi:MAG: bifunctional diguanylate cyclase/phosphodiesterase [Eubacterium sp.]|nr:bifunctional diguanylate cyclase/phosphodiesterase [Eubacterium sp.]
MKKEVEKELQKLIRTATNKSLIPEDFEGICKSVNVVRMYYDISFDSDGYRGVGDEKNDSHFQVIELYDLKVKSGIKKVFPFFYSGNEYVHACIEFAEGIEEQDIDMDTCGILADVIYILVSRQNMRLMLDYAESHDALTGIPNLKAVSSKYMSSVVRNPDVKYVVLYINVKDFKYINDRGGVHLGDFAMAKLAKKLEGYIREDEGICRVGGDNFAFFIRRDNLELMLDRLKSVRVDGLIGLRNNSHRFSFRIGVSDTEVKEFGARLEEASTACIMGRSVLKKDVVIYNLELSEIINYNNSVVAAFADALTGNEFVPYFQPKVNMCTGEILGLEALCRWVRNGEVVEPMDFIPQLDRKGMITELDMAMLESACKSISKWKKMGLKVPVVSVNFSKKNIFVPDIERKIISIIDNNDVGCNLIEIEITETVHESEISRLIEFVRILKNYGIKISIDDFGTGYSSLSLIHNINADEVKIDQSFVKRLAYEDKAVMLVESIINIAERLNMQVIAEGVENAEEGRILLKLGCKIVQGFYYEKPVSCEKTADILGSHSYRTIKI